MRWEHPQGQMLTWLQTELPGDPASGRKLLPLLRRPRISPGRRKSVAGSPQARVVELHSGRWACVPVCAPTCTPAYTDTHHFAGSGLWSGRSLEVPELIVKTP